MTNQLIYKAPHVVSHHMVDSRHYQFCSPEWLVPVPAEHKSRCAYLTRESSISEVAAAIVAVADDYLLDNKTSAQLLGVDSDGKTFIDKCAEEAFKESDNLLIFPSPQFTHNGHLMRSLSIAVAHTVIRQYKWMVLQCGAVDFKATSAAGLVPVNEERALLALERQMRLEWDMCEVVVPL